MGFTVFKRARAYLGVIFAIFARDVRRILRNPVALVITLGMIVMPSAYAWYVVAANWDPYSNTEAMKVAVANEDAGADSAEAGRLDVGASVVASLRENHAMGWEFTDKESAVNGVYAGKYWAALVIPEDFSADFASVFTGDFTPPTIDYYVDEKPSSIAPKVTDAAAGAVQKAVNENFVKTVAEKVVGTTQAAAASTQEQGAAAEHSLTAGVGRARETVEAARGALETLGNTAEATAAAVHRADDTLAALEEDGPRLRETIAEAKELLGQTRTTLDGYGDTLTHQATDGALALARAASEAHGALGTAAGAVAAAEATTRAALEEAQVLLLDNEALVASLEQEAAAADAPAAVTEALAEAREGNDRMAATIAALQNAQTALDATAASLEGEGDVLDEAARSAATATEQTAGTFRDTVMPALTRSLDGLVAACGTLDGALAGMAPSLAEARALLAQLSTTLDSSLASLETTDGVLGTLQDNLTRAESDLAALQHSALVQALTDYLKADPSTVGAFMASPVTLDTHLVYPVKNYGSGVTPFFTNLALWVAGFILMAMVKLRVDPEGLPRFTPTQAYFGRWLFYVTAGLAMGLACCVGDLALGIQCENPAAFIGAGLLTVFVDVNLMFALAYAFRHVGKAVAVILLIVQIPGSSGMFPIEMMPAFFQAIHPLLPFTYSIDAMREAIGGFYGLDYLWDMLWLALLFVPAGFAIGLGLGRASFNLNLLFDEKLGETDLLLAEPVAPGVEAAENAAGASAPAARFHTRTLVRALLDTGAFRDQLVARAQRFQRLYPRLVRVGWVALFAQPLITFAIMVLVRADVDTRALMLMAMVVGIIVVDTYLIVISFLNARLTRQLALADLSTADLHAEAAHQLSLGSPRGGERP